MKLKGLLLKVVKMKKKLKFCAKCEEGEDLLDETMMRF